MTRTLYWVCICCGIWACWHNSWAQNSGALVPLEQVMSARIPRQYTIADVEVKGAHFFDKNLVLSLAHLNIGKKITLPGGSEISKGISNLWRQRIFENVQVYLLKVEERSVFLRIDVQEKPRLSRIIYKGVRKGEQEELNPKFSGYKSKIFTSQTQRNVHEQLRKFYGEKGFLNPSITLETRPDSVYNNSVILVIKLDRGNKNKIENIEFFNNHALSNYELRLSFSETKVLPRLSLFSDSRRFIYGKLKRNSFVNFIKQGVFLSPSRTLKFIDPYFRWNIFAGAKFNQAKYQQDKEKLIETYNSIGYRDARISKDTVYLNAKKRLNIEVKVDEGRKYYFGDISFHGNTKYSDSVLRMILGIKKGDVYDMNLLYSKIGKRQTPEGGEDIGSLYLDDGYLFFRADPIEKRIYGDTIDYEIRIVEGPQATIKNVNIVGNEKTKDFVIRRELRTFPGDKFSRSALIRSQRELANLKFFNPEKIGIVPTPNMEDGTVDITYSVEEKSADQLELAAGYSQLIGFTGTAGITFNNFAIRDIFKRQAWKPIPAGDGEQLSLRVQSNGPSYVSGSLGFVEPWIGNKRRITLSVNGAYTFYGSLFDPRTGQVNFNNTGFSNMRIFSSGVALGKQVKWPDDYFTISAGVNFVQYYLKNYALFPQFSNGVSTNINLKLSISRVSIDQALFPHSGSSINFTAQYTPPYSAFSSVGQINPFSFIEYQKYKLFMDWYIPITKPLGVDKNRQLILKLSAKYGYITHYKANVPLSPFERFQLGDEGLFNQGNFLGFDIIAQRGYYVYDNSNPKINPQQQATTNFFSLFNKYVAELRYPITTNPSATIFGMAYFEAANGWHSFKDYNPLNLRRSVGVGVRFFLPALGMLGFDYALGIDRIQTGRPLGDAFRFHFILGFEPD